MLMFFPLLILLFGIAVLAFWVWMLVDCITNESSEGNDKLVWVLVILFGSWIGALIYFFVRRQNRTAR